MFGCIGENGLCWKWLQRKAPLYGKQVDMHKWGLKNGRHYPYLFRKDRLDVSLLHCGHWDFNIYLPEFIIYLPVFNIYLLEFNILLPEFSIYLQEFNIYLPVFNIYLPEFNIYLHKFNILLPECNIYLREINIYLPV